MMTLNDRRDTGRDPLVGHMTEDADQGAAPRVLASPGHDSAVWEPQADVLETGRVASHPGPVTEGASRIAEKDRLWVNAQRTVLVRLWHTGQMEVATRDATWHTWGPPVYLAEEKP